jgi:hypothetical protein
MVSSNCMPIIVCVSTWMMCSVVASHNIVTGISYLRFPPALLLLFKWKMRFLLKFGVQICEVILHFYMKHWTGPHQTRSLWTGPCGAKPRPVTPPHYMQMREQTMTKVNWHNFLHLGLCPSSNFFNMMFQKLALFQFSSKEALNLVDHWYQAILS